MVTLKSEEFIICASSERVIAFLSDTKNYEELLAGNQISDFQHSPTQFSFKAAGHIELALEKQEAQATLLHFKGLKSNPFAFDLYVHLDDGTALTKGYIEMKADLNTMLMLLVEKPLQKLLKEMAVNLAKKLG